MASTRAAIRYAKAILDLASSLGFANEVSKDMTLIHTTLKENSELDAFIHNPTIAVDVKENVLKEVFSNVNGVTNGLFHLLFVNKRFEILETIALQYNRLFDEFNGQELAIVTTAFPLTPDLESKVLNKIASLTDKKVTIKNVVDESIIGGFILRIGDKQFNASVANSLYVLKRELSN